LQASSLRKDAITPPRLTVIIRDDDISASTRPEILEALYGDLWVQRPGEAPVCLAVVPVLSEHVPRLPGCQDPDPSMWPFLGDLVAGGRADIAMHGYRHEPGEWASSDIATLRRLLHDGRARLESFLPVTREKPVRTFIPPHEHFSPVARELLIDRGFSICTTSANMFPPDRLGWLAYRFRQWMGRPGFYPPVHLGSSCLFAADTYLFSLDASPAACLRRARVAAGSCARFGYPLVVVNHHWHFFDDAGQPRPALLAAWHEFASELAARTDVTFTTFAAYQVPQ
jgi:Uncharacterized protein conserved in bacteria (DUF2334)